MSALKIFATDIPVIGCQAFKPNHNAVVQFVRFRKMRWLPKAPSKIFKVREPTEKDPDEIEQLKKWTNNYKNDMKSIRAYLVDYTSVVNLKRKTDTMELPFEDQFTFMKFQNDEWGKESAHLRKRGMREEEKQDNILALKEEERERREREEMRMKARQEVLKEKEHLDQFIAEENLDIEIDKLLNTRSDSDFALSPDGTIHKRKNTSEDFSSDKVS